MSPVYRLRCGITTCLWKFLEIAHARRLHEGSTFNERQDHAAVGVGVEEGDDWLPGIAVYGVVVEHGLDVGLGAE
jgi:hypothetical protein